METKEWKWKTNDGLQIYSKAWLPAGKPRAVVCLLHGVGEHIGRYDGTAQALTTGGYLLAGFDQRGFGKSEGQLGHASSAEKYFGDIDRFLGEVAGNFDGLPIFLYGHSMGAIEALAYVPLRKPALAGVIATDPGLKNALEEQKVKVALAKVLGSLLPAITLENGVDPQTLSRDPQVAIDYVNDPLVHTKVTTGWGKSMLDMVRLVYAGASRFPLPLLLMHGKEDRLAYPNSSQIYADMAPKDRLTLVMWEGYRHELHNEVGKEAVFKVMLEWMDKHLPGM